MKNLISDTISKTLSRGDEAALSAVRFCQMQLMADKDKAFEDSMLSNAPNTVANETGYYSIGVWEPMYRGKEIVFSRNMNRGDFFLWETTRQEIKLKKTGGTKRVCFVGESTAAGMFFTPHITPALALKDHLSKLQPESDWEVIDLTRISLNAVGLVDLSEACLQLEPDYLIILAGNNWFRSACFEHDAAISERVSYADVLEKIGVPGIANAYKTKVEQHTDFIFKSLCGVLEKHDTQTVFLLPSSNYEDWERNCPVPWLGEKKTARWHEVYDNALSALASDEFHQALTLGQTLLELDGGIYPSSNRLVANSLIKLERFDEAYPYCLAEVDYANVFTKVTSIPGMPSFAKTRILKADTPKNMKIIDLDPILSESLGKKTLDKSLFIDYCHMTPAGFYASMVPVAAHLLRAPSKKFINTEIKPSVDPFILAIGHLYVALYTIHVNQPIANTVQLEEAVVLFQLSVDYSDKILDAMEYYVKARAIFHEDKAIFSLSQCGQRLFELVNSPFDFKVSQHTPGAVDPIAIEAICRCLENNGRQGLRLLSDYQQRFIRLLDKGVDLSEPQFVERVNQVIRLSTDAELSTRRRLPFYKSWWPRSYFTLVSDNTTDLVAQVTCRILNGAEKDVSLYINKTCIKTFVAGKTWHKFEVAIPKETLSAGFNRVCLKWPALPTQENHIIKELSQRYAEGLELDAFPVFGEVYSMVVKRAIG